MAGNSDKGKTKAIRRMAGANAPKVLNDVRNGKYSAPVAIAQAVRTRSPKVSTKDSNPHFKHKELVATVRNTTGAVQVNGFTTNPQSLRVNPLNPKLFNWLSSIGGSYDKYKFTSLRFTYIPDIGSSEAGRLFMSWDPDSQDVPPTNQTALTNQTPNVSINVWKDVTFSVKCDNEWRYTHDSDVVDRKLIDFGQFIFAVWNGGSTNIVGELYVEYSVEFKFPQSPVGPTMFGIVDVGGILTVSGQALIGNADIIVSATGASLYVPTGGVYDITVVLTCTAVTAMNVSGNSTLIGAVRGAFQGNTGIFSCAFSSTGLPDPNSSLTFSGVTGLSRVQLFLARNAPSRGLAAG